jgi:predicted MFS family arabinose efflux permease
MELYIFYFAIAVFGLLTVIYLGYGLYGLIKGGKYTGDLANHLMRKRILFQFLTIMIAMLFLYFIGKGPV